MRDPLALPRFARVDEYAGIWAYEPVLFAAAWGRWAAEDLPRHVAGPAPRPTSTVEMVAGQGGKSVAVVRLMGTLMKGQSSTGGTSTIQARRDIRQAAANPDVSAILLAVDSPGGTVSGTADLAADVRAARKRKPVWAHVDDLAASAAYWVASQADAVSANTGTAQVGSIGTLSVVYDASEAAAKEGVKTLVFRTGPIKGAGVPGDAVTEEQQSYFQALVNEAQTHFDQAVRAGRGMSAERLAEVKTGGVFPAGRAKALGLIDAIRPLDATLAELSRTK